MAKITPIAFGGQVASPSQQQYQSQLANAILARGMDTQGIQTPIEGFAKLGETVTGALAARRADELRRRQEEELKREQERRAQSLSSVLRAGQPWTNPDTGAAAPGTGGAKGMMAALINSGDATLMQEMAPNLMAMQLEDQRARLKKPDVWEEKRGNDIVTFQMGPDGPVELGRAPRWDPNKAPTNVTVRVDGDSRPQIGTIPKDMMAVQAADGSWRFDVIPGSETDRERKAADAQQSAGRESTKDATSIVLEDIARVKSIISESPDLTSGFIGNILKGWAGTDAANVKALTDTIAANIGFEKLNEMRRNSPTGGALGNVTERELSLLAAVKGNIEQSQSADQLLYNLSRLEDTMGSIVHGPVYSRVPQEYRNLTPQEASMLEPGSLFTGTDGVPRVKQ